MTSFVAKLTITFPLLNSTLDTVLFATVIPTPIALCVVMFSAKVSSMLPSPFATALFKVKTPAVVLIAWVKFTTLLLSSSIISVPE